jgi:hypothetical protein
MFLRKYVCVSFVDFWCYLATPDGKGGMDELATSIILSRAYDFASYFSEDLHFDAGRSSPVLPSMSNSYSVNRVFTVPVSVYRFLKMLVPKSKLDLIWKYMVASTKEHCKGVVTLTTILKWGTTSGVRIYSFFSVGLGCCCSLCEW